MYEDIYHIYIYDGTVYLICICECVSLKADQSCVLIFLPVLSPTTFASRN